MNRIKKRRRPLTYPVAVTNTAATASTTTATATATLMAAGSIPRLNVSPRRIPHKAQCIMQEQPTIIMELLNKFIPNTRLIFDNRDNKKYSILAFDGIKHPNALNQYIVTDRYTNYNNNIIYLSFYAMRNANDSLFYNSSCEFGIKINVMNDDVIDVVEQHIVNYLYVMHRITDEHFFDDHFQNALFKFGIDAATGKSQFEIDSMKVLFTCCKLFGIKNAEIIEPLFLKSDPRLWFVLLRDKGLFKFDEDYLIMLLEKYPEAACVYATYCKVRDSRVDNIIINYPDKFIHYCDSIKQAIFPAHQLQIMNNKITDKFVNYYRKKFCL